MNGEPTKKMLILCILDILQKYTDDNHTISQQEIIQYLKREYGITPSRKAIKNNLMNLIDFGYDIEYKIIPRSGKANIDEDDDANAIMTDFHLIRKITDAEMKLLISSCKFSRYIPATQNKDLIRKLQERSSIYFRQSLDKSIVSDTIPRNRQLFHTIEELETAISQKRMVEFTYNNYGTDKRLHPRIAADGRPKRYMIHPFCMCESNGKHYLICSTSNHSSASHYRLDRITDIKILDTPSRPMKEISPFEHGLDIGKYMNVHLNMFTGTTSSVRFKCKKTILNEVIDCFGYNARFENETDDEVICIITVSEQAMVMWATQHLSTVAVLSPARVIDGIRKELTSGIAAYGLTE